MERIVASIDKSTKIVFDTGKFDNWCVYIIDDHKKYAPKDLEYFTEIQFIAKSYPSNKVYTDFLKFYRHTTAEVNPIIIDLIKEISYSYIAEHQFIILKWFTVIYAGMVAEENKEKAILKKRIKHLGIYQLLVEGLKPEVATNFSKGKSWKELNKLMIDKKI